jgi:hypothetical protein
VAGVLSISRICESQGELLHTWDPKHVRTSCCAPMAWPLRRLPDAWVWGGASSAHRSSAFASSALQGYLTSLAGVASRSFPPAVAVYLVTMACERPDRLGRSLSQWDGTELARQLAREGIVDRISAVSWSTTR